MAGPETPVKDALRKACNAHPDRIDHFTVMTRGLGASGVSDRCGTVKFWASACNDETVLLSGVGGGLPVGIAFRIECKGGDTGKKNEPTALQLKRLVANAMLGGFSAVCRPTRQTIYFRDGTTRDLEASPAELVEYMLGGEWLR